jgi:ABC-type transporter Mla MlaB component
VELPHDVMLDASAVERIDTATLQLLAAFVATRAGAGRVVRWRLPSESLVHAADRLGLHTALRLAEPA